MTEFSFPTFLFVQTQQSFYAWYCMWNILYTAVITVIVLLCIHHLYNYLTVNLTTPITHDAVAFRDKKLAEIKEPEVDSVLEHFKKV
jgi:hypothetical protein